MLKIGNLRCEYKENPIGLDVKVPRLSWQLESDNRGVLQTAYRIQVSRDTGFESGMVWDTGKVNKDRSVHIDYGGGVLEPRTRYFYRIQAWDNKGETSGWSDAGFWETGLMGADGWKASWIAPDAGRAFPAAGRTSGETPDSVKDGILGGHDTCPMLRGTFRVDGRVRSARVYASALGLYELHINGERIGDHYFAPGWTSYNKRLQYQTYDVTELLRAGNNTAGAVLGSGWYKGELTWSDHRDLYGDRLALLFQLHITYEDGREECFVSNETWKASTGPILMSSIYHGEIYDARLEQEGWDAPGFDDGLWNRVEILDHSREILISQENVPVRIIEEIKPIGILVTPKGETVLDFGQNMVGWVHLRAEGSTGTEIVLQHAEVLDSKGNFYTENLRKAKQTVKYIMKGKGLEDFRPHFTFQGFRYVRVTGYPGQLKAEAFAGEVLHSEMEPTGTFNCSDPLVNQLQHNIVWGQKGNFLDVPTDCPQRDERLGWTGDAQMFIRTACFNMNVAPFFHKWLGDLEAEQFEDGGIPFVIPDAIKGVNHSSAAWGDAAVICPWTIYTCYGDKSILERQYGSMKKWVEYIRHQGDDEYLWNTGFHFGDWLGLDSKSGSYVGATPKDFIATAFYAHSCGILAKAAGVLGYEEDEAEYRELHKNIEESFRKEFVTPNGRLSAHTQTAYVLALMFDLVEEKHRKRTVETLAKYLEENDWHLTTGFVGTPYLCHVLSENGRDDLAYRLLLQKDYPSWLYPVLKGATTIWEHWDGIMEDGSFWSPDMNSFNHYAYGSIGDWLYRVVAGIDASAPGYSRIRLRPRPGDGLDSAEASLRSMYGQIRCAWRKTEDGLVIEVDIPANTTASVILPCARVEKLTEGGKKASEAEAVSEIREGDGEVLMEVGSGSYRFAV